MDCCGKIMLYDDCRWLCKECGRQIHDTECCGGPMGIHKDYWLCCDTCGLIRDRKNLDYIQYLPETKKQEFDPIKHFDDCIRHILNWVPPPKGLDLNKIRAYIGDKNIKFAVFWGFKNQFSRILGG